MASVSISGLRRNIKNVAHNYTDAQVLYRLLSMYMFTVFAKKKFNQTPPQVKVREATSNDPWGPSSTQMSEIADLTYNMVSWSLCIISPSSNIYQVAFSEIMQMIWKRLNDHGKNWRHVYKALVLLEYLIKTGSEKVKITVASNKYSTVDCKFI